MMDAGNNEQAAFTNVFVLYASSGVKDDGVTRQYDLTGGTGIYLTKGGWETIQWTKGDATAPLQLTDASGKTLDVNPGKSFLAIWGGYYGQALRLLDRDGNEQALPENRPCWTVLCRMKPLRLLNRHSSTLRPLRMPRTS